MKRHIRVLIVDDSAAMRQLLKEILSTDPEIEVIGVASDPVVAREKIKQLNPDVLTLDIEMPNMDGLTFLEKLMRARPMPVVMVSSLTQSGADATIRALELGAVDFVPKPTIDVLRGIGEMRAEIISKVKSASLAAVKRREAPPSYAQTPVKITSLSLTHKIIALGASTGGTEALREALVRFPADAPGVVIVQHMPPGFTKSFAERLNSLCAMSVKEAEDGDRVLPGHAYVAPGGKQMQVVRSGAEYRLRVYAGAPVNLHTPSVDVLFDSVAAQAGKNAVGAIFTGMGADGADGMKRMHDAGIRCAAQDEASCVVFGMPKEAIKRGGVDAVLPLHKMAEWILKTACDQPQAA